MAAIPKNYNPRSPRRLLPEGDKKILIVNANIEQDKFDTDGKREVVVLKIKIIGEEPIYTKFFRLPINWTIPGTTETQEGNKVQGRQIAAMLELVLGQVPMGNLDVSPLEGEKFIWSIKHSKVKSKRTGEENTYDNISRIARIGDKSGDTIGRPASDSISDVGEDFGSDQNDEYQVPF